MALFRKQDRGFQSGRIDLARVTGLESVRPFV